MQLLANSAVFGPEDIDTLLDLDAVGLEKALAEALAAIAPAPLVTAHLPSGERLVRPLGSTWMGASVWSFELSHSALTKLAAAPENHRRGLLELMSMRFPPDAYGRPGLAALMESTGLPLAA